MGVELSDLVLKGEVSDHGSFGLLEWYSVPRRMYLFGCHGIESGSRALVIRSMLSAVISSGCSSGILILFERRRWKLDGVDYRLKRRRLRSR